MKAISLSINVLKAAVLCCGTKNVRESLQGVCISAQDVISTDGCIMFKHPMGGCNETQYIIHHVDLKTLFKNLDKKVTKALKLGKTDYPFFDFSTSTDACIISYETCNTKMYYMPCRTR